MVTDSAAPAASTVPVVNWCSCTPGTPPSSELVATWASRLDRVRMMFGGQQAQSNQGRRPWATLRSSSANAPWRSWRALT